MKGNICRCGTYQRIRQAIHKAAELNKAPAKAARGAAAHDAEEALVEEPVGVGGAA